MAVIVADTDVLIDFLAGTNPAAERVAEALQRGDLVTTAVSQFELLSGTGTERQNRAIRQLLAVLAVLPFDGAAADRAAEVHRRLQRRGEGIGMGDSLIAGIVLASRGSLLTRNVRHFSRVDGLPLETL